MSCPIVDVSNLTFEYPGKRALHGLSFTLEQGSVTALVGPNGAGKTTLLRCLAALETPYSGRVAINGIDTAADPRACHRCLGFLADRYGLYEQLPVRRCLTYMALSHGVDAAYAAERVKETAAQVELDQYLDVPAAELSRGLRQRLAIGQAIIHRPPLLLLDEPASGLDPEARLSLSRLILRLRDAGHTLLVSSHILAELADYSSAMLSIENGRIGAHEQLAVLNSAPERRIVLRLARPFPALESQLVAAYGVAGLQMKEQEASFLFTGTLDAQHEILRDLIAGGAPIVHFAEERMNLQDLYLMRARQTKDTNDASGES